jgi:hypothetical protein
MSVQGNLREAAELFENRNPEYGDGWKRSQKLLEAFFPNGVVLKTPEDMARFANFNMLIVKLVRYATMMEEGGHLDSIEDLMVYAAMLKERTHGSVS